MKKPHPAWYYSLALVALSPVGLRALTWRSSRPDPVDPAMAQVGQVLFKHNWTVNDKLANGGDGLGPVFNAKSCVACHNQGSPGGAGGLEHNVTTFVVRDQSGQTAREGVVHAAAISRDFQENLAMLDADTLLPTTNPSLQQVLAIMNGDRNHCKAAPTRVHLSQRQTPALFGAKLIDDIPEREIIANERKERLRWGLSTSESEEVPVGRALRLANGKIGRFGWKAQTASLSDFVQAACANELGLGNPGQTQPRTLNTSKRKNEYEPGKYDLTQEQCDQLTAFCASLPRPVERLPDDYVGQELAAAGKKRFAGIGCADCHMPDIGSVTGIYSDLLLHRMGQPLQGGGSYNEPPIPLPEFDAGQGPQAGEWRTPPLWGVADSAPYLHDGRAATLEEAIRMHGGQGARSAQLFANLPQQGQQEVVAFLMTLRAP